MASLGFNRADLSNKKFIESAIKKFDFIVSIHSRQIFPRDLVSNLACLNFHPGFNPHNRGIYPHVFSIINKLPIGATLHVMDEKIDHGEIIDQVECQIEEHDTSIDLYKKIIFAEKYLIKKNLPLILSNRWRSFVPSEGNYNSLKDFEKLCELDLESTGTLRSHIDLLRSLSHPPYKNAYFETKSGERVYVKISLECESI